MIRNLVAVVLVALLGQVPVGAFHLSLSRADMERALALARWPHSETDRTRFHDRYLVNIKGPTVEYFSITQAEIVTEFRRLELIADALNVMAMENDLEQAINTAHSVNQRIKNPQ